MLINIGLYTVLSVTVGLLAVTVGYTAFWLVKREFGKLFNTVPVLVASVGSLAAVSGVLLFKLDIDLKNRPYVYAEPKIISQYDNTFISKTTITNCGNTPAYNVVFESKMRVNGAEVPKPPRETKSFSVYPNGIQYHHFPIVFNPGDEIDYSIDIDYYDSAGEDFHYSGFYKFWDRGGGAYSWKTIYTE